MRKEFDKYYKQKTAQQDAWSLCFLWMGVSHPNWAGDVGEVGHQGDCHHWPRGDYYQEEEQLLHPNLWKRIPCRIKIRNLSTSFG